MQIISFSKHHPTACLLALLFASVFFLMGQPCCLAQTPVPPSSLTQNETANSQTFSEPSIALPPLVSERERHFDTLLEQISAKGNITIIAEDRPLQFILSEKDALALQNQLAALIPNGTTIPVSQLVDKVAGAFDYQSVRFNPSTYLLCKRYTNPQDLPFVPYEEVLRCYQNFQRALLSLDAAVPVGGDTAAAIHFIESLDTDQKWHLSGGGIAVADLNNQQRQWAWHHAVSHAIGHSSAAVVRNVRYLQSVHSPQSLFRRIDFFDTGLMVLSFEGPYSPDGAVWEQGLSHGFFVQNGGLSATQTTNGKMVMTGKISGPPLSPKSAAIYTQLAADLPDRDPPTPEDYAPQKPPSSHTITLSAFAQQRNAAPGEPLVPIVVDDVLGSKAVTLFNEKNVKNEELLQAIAAVYGLRVQHRQKDLFLTTPQAKPVKSISELPALIDALFPTPLRRALQGDADRTVAELMTAEEQKMGKMSVTSAKGKRALEIYTKISEQRTRTYDVPRQRQQVLYRAAVHQLRVLIEPKINTAPDKRYLMRDMTEEEKRLFALVCILPSLSDVNLLSSQRLPRSLVNFDQAVLTGRIDSPVPGVHYLGIAYRDETGKLHAEGGIGLTTGSQQTQPPAVPAAPKP